jgi:FlaA1/EpsC-like NDP-sugar epimerase
MEAIMKNGLEYCTLRRVLKKIIDILALGISYVFLVFLKYDFEFINYFRIQEFFVFLSIALVVFTFRKTDRNSWSYVNSKDAISLAGDVFFINVFYLIYILLFSSNFSIYLLPGNIILNVFTLLTVRVLKKYKTFGRNRESKGTKTLIIGAGDAADTLLREYRKNPKLKLDIVGLIDDDEKKKNLALYGYKVLGNRYDIPRLIKDYGILQVIIAIPSAGKKEIRELYKLCRQEKVEIKVLPTFTEILDTKSMSSQIREINVEDLLGREPIEINTKSIAEYIEDKVVFITGGAGSIGSELARQIVKYNPKLLVNIDVNENSLYFLELEIKGKYKNVNVVSEICNIREREKVKYLFEKYNPDLVYHAAAHKHVPLMEHNPEEAIKNNIFGTKNLVELCDEFKVDRFVLISTDKAVNPTNIMGATKRAAELIIEDINKNSKTKFMAVRFGNVLGSNGSVIPIFQNLIKKGKNLTLTHPEITRYFMTIPEATQLVLEAGSIGRGGEVFVLDMGEPVKIMDLAKNLIELSGLTLGVDIDIDIVGLRPGEKLYEELLYDMNSALKTENKKIFIAKLKDDSIDVKKHVGELLNLIKNEEYNNLKAKLKEFVVTYREAKAN